MATKKEENSLTRQDLDEIKQLLRQTFKELIRKKDLDKIFAMFEAVSNQISEMHADILINRRLYQMQLKNSLSPEEMKEFVKISKQLEEGTLAEKLQN